MKKQFLFKAPFLASAYAQASLASALGLTKTFAFAHHFRFNSALLGLALFGLILGGWGCRRSGLQVSQEEFVALPQGAIPFIYDGHLYVSAQLCDSLPSMLIFDSGADFLYLDKDYATLSAFKDLPLRKYRG